MSWIDLGISIKVCLGCIIGFFALARPLPGQDHFTQTIDRGLRVGIENFATIPDSSGAPPALSVMTTDPLGRLFVNDQRGQIYSVSSSGSTVTPYLDINNFSGINLIAGGEAGLQSFAFHPDFASDGSAGFGKFFTIHSSSNVVPTPNFALGSGDALHSVLLEWSVADPNASTYGNNAPREILRFGQPFGNHNAGQIAFNTAVGAGDPDRNNLYVSLGDGGAAGDSFEAAQDRSTPFGAVLRIDPLGTNGANGQYGIVAANSLASDGDNATLGEIYAYGLRNPQRFSWDSQTGNLYAADIGQNAVEEIDLLINGGNYGWDQREGSFEFEGPLEPGMIDPIAEYDRINMVSDLPTNITQRAVTVGDVVRGSSIPNLNGNLLLGDFPTGVLFHLNVDSDPLNGGQDGLLELVLVDENGRDVRLLELINETRATRGLGGVTRTDLRFSYGIDGQFFVLNKHDGMVRRLTTAVPEPSSGLWLVAIAWGGMLHRRRR